MKRSISLHHLTALDATPSELIGIAAALECDAVCLFTHIAAKYANRFPCIATLKEAGEIGAQLRDADMAACNLEIFNISPEWNLSEMRPGLERGALLGAARATAHVHDADETRAADHFAEFCALAAQYQMTVGLEFTGFSAITHIDVAARFIQRSGAGNAAIAVDALHVFRNGMSIEDLAAHASRISYAQICDGPLAMPEGGYFKEAVENREVPGCGEFPLASFIAALPPDVPISIEVPMHRLKEAGVSAGERARRAVAGAMRLIAR